MHHVAFEVDDVGAELERLASHGAELVDERPRRGRVSAPPRWGTRSVMTETAATRKESEAKRVRVLVDRAQKGERAALEELYLIHFDRIYSYLHVSVGNRHDAEDLTTQTFLKMLEAIGRFR